MLIELHMIKSFPPTNLNRDETGSPKSCNYGGVLRGRISSQSIKHAWRRDSEFQNLPLGVRTRHMPDEVVEKLLKAGISEDFVQAVKPKLTAFGNRDAKESETMNTSQIMFFSPEDIQALTDEVITTLSTCETAKAVKDIKVKDWQDKLKKMKLDRPITLDMALFGRMITDDSFKNVEAAMQVAHAISTHAVNQESDFFTAVDDLVREYGEDEGSAMMGNVDFNACCYYFYASLDTDQLLKNVEGSTEVVQALPRLLPALISSMVFTNPSGKQNSFAGHALPGLVVIQKKSRKIPVSYAAAFESPVYSHNGYTEKSIKRLIEYINTADTCYGIEIDERLWFYPKEKDMPQNARKVDSMQEMLELVKEWI